MKKIIFRKPFITVDDRKYGSLMYDMAQHWITNELNSDYDTPLDSWTYADKYETLPTLSDEWIRETDENVARTLAINSQDQFLCNFYFEQTWIRPMPIYSVPSLTGWN